MSASSGNSNGGKAWLNSLTAILQALVIAGILGLFASVNGIKDSISEVKQSNARLETTINERGRQNDRDIERIDGTLSRHDQRITDVERSIRPSQPDPNHRQKR